MKKSKIFKLYFKYIKSHLTKVGFLFIMYIITLKRDDYMRIVFKVGTSTLAYPSGRLNIRRVKELCTVLSDLKNSGIEIVLVTSGAIGMGVGKLSLGERPADMATKQAAAAVGQCELMYVYDKEFGKYNHTVAQLLLTANDFKNEERYSNLQGTMLRLLSLGALPIVNENDTIATEEIKVGDNDTLSALVAVAVNANMLILLSDIDGLYTANPHNDKNAKLIKEVNEITPEILALGGGAGSSLGTGGMATKLHAAQIATENGCDMVIMNGAAPEKIYDLFECGKIGTYFHASVEKKERR